MIAQLHFELPETIKLVAESARDFSEKHIRPHVMEWDEDQIFPKPLFKDLGNHGFLGVLVPEKLGGAGMGYHEYIAIIEEISKIDPSIGLSVAAHNSLCTNHILSFGNETQKEKWIPRLALGEWLGAWGLTEHNTGSDAGGMNTTAVKADGGWVINGTKNFITHGKSAEVTVVIARTGKKGDSHGITAFVVETSNPGFSAGKKENKLGMRASETAEMVFTDCFVSDDAVLGDIGDGFIQSMKILDGGRISIGALSLGIAKGAYEAALQYSSEREQFGQSINKFQAIAFKLADMATKIEAAELLLHKAASLKNKNVKMTKESAMCKYYASEICVEIASDAVQIFGGYGFTKDYPVEKFYRDAKLCTIGEGTSEIQKLVIARNIIGK